MRKVSGSFLVVPVLSIVLAAASGAAASQLYVTNGDGSRLAIVETDTGTLIGTFTTVSGGYPLVVRDTMWLGRYYGDTAVEYDLAGVATGNTVPYTDIDAVDGAASATTSYQLGNAFTGSATVYGGGLDFSGSTSLFSVSGSDLVGITYDVVSGNLWISDQGNIYQYTTGGALVSQFAHASGRGCLAYEASSDTLWYVRNASNVIDQYSKAGALLQSLTVAGLASNNWGAEFATAAAPQLEAIPTVSAAGAALLALLLAGLGFAVIRFRAA
jgi:hypothetical protein